MKKYKAEITFIVVIQAENNDEASDILWEWNPLHPDADDFEIGQRIYPDNVEFEEIKNG